MSNSSHDVLAMLERHALRHPQRLPSARRDQLWRLSEDIARSLETLLKSGQGLPVPMHESTLRAARELLLVQISILDELIELSRSEPSPDGYLAHGERGMPYALPRSAYVAPQQPVASMTEHASDPRRADLNTLLGRVGDIGRLTRPTVLKLGIGVTAAASVIFWLSSSGVQTNGQSKTASAPQGTPSGTVSAVPMTGAPTDSRAEGPSETASLATSQVAGVGGGAVDAPVPVGTRPLTATTADPPLLTEPRFAVWSQVNSKPVNSKPADRLPSDFREMGSAAVSGAPNTGGEVAGKTSAPAVSAARTAMAAAPLTATDLPSVLSESRPSAGDPSPTARIPSPAVATTSPDDPAQSGNQPTGSAVQSGRADDRAKKSPSWTTATVPAAAPRFAPILVTLRDGPAALQIFEELKQRHAAVLANKSAQLRSFVGPDGNTWFHLIALPAVTEAEARNLCQALGAEGKALGCSVAPL